MRAHYIKSEYNGWIKMSKELYELLDIKFSRRLATIKNRWVVRMWYDFELVDCQLIISKYYVDILVAIDQKQMNTYRVFETESHDELLKYARAP